MQTADEIWLNGDFVDWEDANVHLTTHALHYGTAVFEGIRCYETADGTAIFRFSDHMERLYNSAKIFRMDLPFEREEIEEKTLELLRRNELESGYIRHIFYYAGGGLGVNPQKNEIDAAIIAFPWGAYLGEEALEHGVPVKIASWNRPYVNSTATKAKLCGNYVNSALATIEADEAGADEALLLTTDGTVAEGAGENFFIIKNEELITPPLTNVLEGITRDSIITIARDKGYTVREEVLTRDQVYTADEAFFTGTAAEVTPVSAVDNITIGNGGRGPITEELQSAFFDAVEGKREEYADWLTHV